MSTATAAPAQRQKQWDTRRTEKRRRLDAVRQIADKIGALEDGQPVDDLVDRQLGY